MDGIVHAGFVLARLHYLMRGLSRATSTDADVDRVESSLENYRHDFLKGDEVIRTHARFTPVGIALYRAARDYMLSSDDKGFKQRKTYC
jgi:hypothetical protein